jgi:hypothetical protein
MTDRTENLDMPFILPAQAQKHVTHNEALLQLDALVHLSIVSEEANPPQAPMAGSRYLVAAQATGGWSGRAGRIAVWQDGYWAFAVPKTGWRAWFEAAAKMKVYDGASWRELPLPENGSLATIGIGTSADQNNRIAVSSPASLFNHAGGGHQLKVNKAGATDTATLLFQSGWTGYAEMGLAGNNAFSIKVSNGTEWRTGLSIDGGGRVSLPNQPAARAFRSGTSFTPTAAQQSGFTTFGVNKGGFTLGAAAAGGGNAIVVPATGLYLVSLNISALTSSGHGASLLGNGSTTILTLNGISGSAQSQGATCIFSLTAGDTLTLQHSGTAQIALGAGKTELSLAML